MWCHALLIIIGTAIMIFIYQQIYTWFKQTWNDRFQLNIKILNRDGRISTDLLKTNNVQTVHFLSSQLPFLILFNRLYTLPILPPLFSKIRQIHEICVSLILVFKSYVALRHHFQSQSDSRGSNVVTQLLTHTLRRLLSNSDL